MAPVPQFGNHLLQHEVTLVTNNLEEKNTHPERLRRRDAAAPVSDSCASLWACSSPRSRYRAQPAPWLWCCRAYCFNASHSITAECGYRCSLNRFFLYCLQGRREFGSSATLVLRRAPASLRFSPLLSGSAAPVCRLPVWGSDLSGYGFQTEVGGPRKRDRLPTQHVEVR